MSPDQYRAALDHLGLTQTEAAQLFGVHRVTACRWASDGVPETAAILLRLMLAGKITTKDLRKAQSLELSK